ncbi:MAG: flagellar hook-basal body protein [Phycisphaerae bacterium]|nr:flagellar hook-basal body protein [Phycisphaerae bacterium]
MIYGLYLSASGMMASSHRQDVIANNLANVETTGFKRALTTLQQRSPESVESGRRDLSDPLLDGIGGGIFIAPTRIDRSQGLMQPASSPLQLAIFGQGYFAIQDRAGLRLTRNGNFMLDRQGTLVLADGSGREVLDASRRPIRLEASRLHETRVGESGAITVNGEFVAQLGLFDVDEPARLVPAGGTALMPPAGQRLRPASGARVQAGYLEAANVDPAFELTQLIDAQRQLEANANMIRYQDQTLGRLVNEVGKIG